VKALAAVDLCIPILGLVCTVALFGAGFRPLAEGCLAGAVLASLDWLLLRILMNRLYKTSKEFTLGKLAAGVILGIKFVILAVFFYFVIYKFNFNPYGVAIGVGSLPLGIIIGFALSMRGEKKTKENNHNA
jgi:hypothetical protein